MHYLEMLLAMGVGMVALGPVLMRHSHHSSAVIEELLMVTAMVIGMVAWMACRRHAWLGILQMAAAMYSAVGVLLPFVWLGLPAESWSTDVGHILMLLGAAACMLHRREEYMVAR